MARGYTYNGDRFKGNVQPFKMGIGRQNIRVNDTSSQAAFERSCKQGFGDIVQSLAEFVGHMGGVAPDIATQALQPTFELSQTYCPEDTGKLRSSGYVEAVPFRGGARAEIGYARGGVPDYAAFVHERTDIRHDPPTRSKFLEAAVDEDYFEILKRLTLLTKMAAGGAGA